VVHFVLDLDFDYLYK